MALSMERFFIARESLWQRFSRDASGPHAHARETRSTQRGKSEKRARGRRRRERERPMIERERGERREGGREKEREENLCGACSHSLSCCPPPSHTHNISSSVFSGSGTREREGGRADNCPHNPGAACFAGRARGSRSIHAHETRQIYVSVDPIKRTRRWGSGNSARNTFTREKRKSKRKYRSLVCAQAPILRNFRRARRRGSVSL